MRKKRKTKNKNKKQKKGCKNREKNLQKAKGKKCANTGYNPGQSGHIFLKWWYSSLRKKGWARGERKNEWKKERSDSHIRACQSPLPVAKMLPVGLRSIEITETATPSGRNENKEEKIWFITWILVSLEHALHSRRTRIPELHSSIFRARYHPLTIVRHGYGEHVILNTREGKLWTGEGRGGQNSFAPCDQ